MMNILALISSAFIFLIALLIIIQLIRSIRLVPNMKALLVERLGKYYCTLEPGFHILIPFLDKVAYTQDLREQAISVAPQDCFTKDNVKVVVDGVIYISISDPVNASYGVINYKYAAIQLAQTTTRSIIGVIDLDKTFEERELISTKVVEVLNEVALKWGINVHRYEVKNISPPLSVENAMEKQMTAERDRRAMISRSEGQKQATINDSEGKKAEMINKSEGEMRRRINFAEGKAAEITTISLATAESIKKISLAIGSEKGHNAMKMRLSQQQLNNLEKLAKQETEVILPADLTQFQKLIEGLGLK